MKRTVYLARVAVFALLALCPGVCGAFTTEALEEAGVTFTGYVETEISYLNGEEDEGSDVALSELTLGVEYAPADWLSAAAVLIYEDGAGGVEVDEAYAAVGGTESLPLVLTVGRLYLPLGAYCSEHCSGVLCTDSLTQALSEAQEDVVQVTYLLDVAVLTAGVANGDVDQAGEDDVINTFYGAVEVAPIEGLVVGAACTSNLADSDELTGLMPEDGVVDQVAAVSVYAICRFGRFYGQAEYVAALDDFAAADLDADEDGRGDQPQAINIELGYDLLEDLQIGARCAATEEFGAFPETQYGVVANYAIFEGAVLALEVLRNELPGGGEEESVIGRLAVEF
jgi:hypothetical protein